MKSLLGILMCMVSINALAMDCPDISKLTQGKFDNTYKKLPGYNVEGFLDIDGNIYNRWLLLAYNVNASEEKTAINKANDALHAGRIIKLTDKADCQDNRGSGFCECEYQLNIDDSSYKMMAFSY